MLQTKGNHGSQQHQYCIGSKYNNNYDLKIRFHERYLFYFFTKNLVEANITHLKHVTCQFLNCPALFKHVLFLVCP